MDGWRPGEQCMDNAPRDEQFPRGFPRGKGLGPSLPRVPIPEKVQETLYDPSGAMRQQVCEEGVVWHWSGAKGNEWLSQAFIPALGVVRYWTRVRGKYQEIRRDMPNVTWRCFFTDYRGDNGWCKVRCVHASGREVHYEGESLNLSLRMVIMPKGNVIYFEGEGRGTYKVRTYIPPNRAGGHDILLHYGWYNGYSIATGGKRVMTSQVVSDGRVRIMDGAPAEERIIRTILPSGNVQEFEGPRGSERLVRNKMAGDVFHYKGERGHEAIYRMERVGGDVHMYKGPKGNEHLTSLLKYDRDRTVLASVTTYAGKRGQERRSRKMDMKDGCVHVFSGGSGSGLPNGLGLTYEEDCNRILCRSGALVTRRNLASPWVVLDESDASAPAAKRQRVMDTAQGLYAELEALTEKVSAVQEGQLIELGEHFKALREAVSKCVA